MSPFRNTTNQQDFKIQDIHPLHHFTLSFASWCANHTALDSCKGDPGPSEFFTKTPYG